MEPRCPNCSTTQQPVWRVCVGEEPILDAIEAVSEAYKSATIASQETLEQSTVGIFDKQSLPSCSTGLPTCRPPLARSTYSLLADLGVYKTAQRRLRRYPTTKNRVYDKATVSWRLIGLEYSTAHWP